MRVATARTCPVISSPARCRSRCMLDAASSARNTSILLSSHVRLGTRQVFHPPATELGYFERPVAVTQRSSARYRHWPFRCCSSPEPDRPQLLGQWVSGAAGTHRNFYNGGQWVYATSTLPGFEGHVLAIVDISDPANSLTVGTWWHPGAE